MGVCKKTRFIWFIIVLLFFTSFHPIINAKDSTAPETAHVIADVPYVSQEIKYFCCYACTAMAIKSFNVNTTLHEVLFNSGVGYSLLYSMPKMKRFLISSMGSSNWKSDREFLAVLYGLHYEEPITSDPDKSTEENWEDYWSLIKEYILNDEPVITVADPVYLSSIRKCVCSNLPVSVEFVNKLPPIVWDFVPCLTNHVILIVGFNEENNSICYHDPIAEVLGHQEFGYYEWMNLSTFKYGAQKLVKTSPRHAFNIWVFQEAEEEAMDTQTRFETAYARNIERMKGNLTVYDQMISEGFGCYSLGIQSLEQYAEDLDKGLNSRITTILLYKVEVAQYLFAVAYRIYNLLDKVCPSVLNLSDYNSQMNYCYQLQVEKEVIAAYLRDLEQRFDDPALSELCSANADLLEQEATHCAHLADGFLLFLSRGLFISLPRAIQITDTMRDALLDMINVEDDIIRTQSLLPSGY